MIRAPEPARIAGIVSEHDPHNVVQLPLTRERTTEIVREIARAERWSVNMDYDADQQYRRTLNRRQVDRCLREGYVLDDHAKLDSNGNWRTRIVQVCSGVHVTIDVAIEPGPVPRLFVVAIRGDVIEI